MTTRIRPQRGFTLIELLVVVAIVSLLLGMIAPALHDARRRCKLVMCGNNLRSIWTGVQTYVLESADRVPFMEDVNLTNPNADPFDENSRTTAGVVMLKYVQPGSWRCPDAVAGFPLNAGRGAFRMTYVFSTAGPVGAGIPYDSHPQARSGGPLDPAMSNYVHFDGRPARLMDGRRYVAPPNGLNENRKGRWSVRFPVIADAIEFDRGSQSQPIYPHRGVLKRRFDLENALDQFEQNTNTRAVTGAKSGRNELHLDGEAADVMLTRNYLPHAPGY